MALRYTLDCSIVQKKKTRLDMNEEDLGARDVEETRLYNWVNVN